MNPVVEIILCCEVCGGQLYTKRVVDMPVPRFDLAMCGSRRCSNYGVLLVTSPASLNRQIVTKLAEFEVPKHAEYRITTWGQTPTQPPADHADKEGGLR